MKRLALVLIVLLAAAASGRADTVYNVQGTAALIGNNNCNGPCIEVLQFSFQLGFRPSDIFSNWLTPFIVPGSSKMSSFGPLGSFSPFSYWEFNSYAGTYDQLGDEIDMESSVFFDPVFDEFAIHSPRRPTFYAPFLWGCGTQTCADDFSPFPFQGQGSGIICCTGPSTISVEAVQTPEPSSLALLGAGMLLVCGLKRKRGVSRGGAD